MPQPLLGDLRKRRMDLDSNELSAQIFACSRCCVCARERIEYHITLVRDLADQIEHMLQLTWCRVANGFVHLRIAVLSDDFTRNEAIAWPTLRWLAKDIGDV